MVTDYVDWNAEIDNFQLSPPSSPIHIEPETLISSDVPTVSLSSPAGTTPDLVQVGFSDEMFANLVDMGFSTEMIHRAIEETGPNADILVIIDTISNYSPKHDNKKRRIESTRDPLLSADYEPIRLPNPMIGFGLPNEPGLITHRSLPDRAQGPPYFYYENVALVPKGAWDTISSHLYDIAPEFVDSKYICAAARKRGYVHNLPIDNRFQLQPLPKYTILEAFPRFRRCWPTWDTRTKLSSILPVIASVKIPKRISIALEPHNGEPPLHVQRYVIDQCRKWNLVWVGKNKTATLEPDEMETLLGFPPFHTRGMSMIERYKSLGNSFQVDTVAYHLSVLKRMFPNGINVLSLFTGIGGALVALYRLQVPMNLVVSVEISKTSRNILKGFWEKTKQNGVLREFGDVQDLTNWKIEELMEQCGGFHLVIGGSKFAGRNRVCRSGLEGDQPILFFEYCRILEVVRQKTARMRRHR